MFSSRERAEFYSPDGLYCQSRVIGRKWYEEVKASESREDCERDQMLEGLLDVACGKEFLPCDLSAAR